MISVVQKDISHELQYELFDIKKLELNSYVPFDILIKKDNGFVIIIKMGTFLSENIYNKLSKQKQLYISSSNHSVKHLTCSNLEHYIQINIDLNPKLIDLLYKIHKKNYPKLLEQHYNEKTTECVHNIVHSIVSIIQQKKDFIKNTVQYFSNEYELETHSLHVALYAVNLGNLLHFNQEQLLHIGVAGLLHDIGLSTIDKDVITHNEVLNPSQLNIIQQHPKKSVSIAEHNHIHNPHILNAIMHHHERYDGSGYPDKLVEQEISRHAAILAICDVFDALTNDRPYRKKFSYFEALKFMIKDETMSNKFSTQYLQAFLKSLV